MVVRGGVEELDAVSECRKPVAELLLRRVLGTVLGRVVEAEEDVIDLVEVEFMPLLAELLIDVLAIETP